MAEVRIERLIKVFPGGTVAVDDVSILVADGEFLVMLGPSGCGKTTTLRSVAGLERQTSGDIFIDNRLVNDLSPADRDIAFVFQFYALYPHLKVYDNIAFPLKATNVSKAETEERVQKVAKILKIDHLLNNKPDRLPAGEQQRVALGRAMIRRPQVFLLDEPLTNLDAALRVVMRGELKRLHKEIATTTLYVTHDQTEAMSLGDRVAVLSNGKLEQIGTPLEIYDCPASLFVAGFIGTPPMNFLDVKLMEGPKLVSMNGKFSLSIPDALTNKVDKNQALRLGIRSEDIHLFEDVSKGDMPAKVYVCEPMGDEILYGICLAGEYLMLAKAPVSMELVVGQQIGVKFDRERMHIFDVQSAKAVR